MSLVNQARIKILELTRKDINIHNRNVFKETLRQLKYIFGNIYYTDGQGESVKIHCTTGKQERAIGKLMQENNLVLPLITISEDGIINDDKRMRNCNVIVNESYWDPVELRAKRVLSLPPRAVNLGFIINIWTKYMEDMDMVRSSILNMFNPYLSIDTKFSDYTIGYLETESDLADSTAPDNTDRLVQKSMRLVVETYVPSPKFLYTNTGEIHKINYELDLENSETEIL